VLQYIVTQQGLAGVCQEALEVPQLLLPHLLWGYGAARGLLLLLLLHGLLRVLLGILLVCCTVRLLLLPQLLQLLGLLLLLGVQVCTLFLQLWGVDRSLQSMQHIVLLQLCRLRCIYMAWFPASPWRQLPSRCSICLARGMQTGSTILLRIAARLQNVHRASVQCPA
jgi:hypothetical protein